MSKLKDMTGHEFNAFTVLKRVENSKTNSAMWLCICKQILKVDLIDHKLKKNNHA